MALIKFFEADGVEIEVDVPNGDTLMEGARFNGVEGILAECGGSCACATCHCYIDEAWFDKLPPMQDLERGTLAAVRQPQPNSRLSCQIWASDELDGLVVYLPESQY